MATALDRTGRWWPGDSLGFSGTHVALLRKAGTDSSSVFIFGESGTNQAMGLWRFAPSASTAQLPTKANIFNIPHPNDAASDLFCSGHVTLPDGKLLLIGGQWLPIPLCQHVYMLDPSWTPGGVVTTPWTQNASMAVERWYASAVPMHDGRVTVHAGSMSSSSLGFGGLADSAGNLSTYGSLRQIQMSGRAAWGVFTSIPGDAVSSSHPTIHRDTYTAGQAPEGREGHAFVADGAGRGILIFGRKRLADGSYKILPDVWSSEATKALTDTVAAWRRLEQFPIATGAALPVPRHHFAYAWGGVEKTLQGQLSMATDSQFVFIHGGLDSSSAVLGDLWRGARVAGTGNNYGWRWTKLLDDAPERRRFGHSMFFDPGPLTDLAPYARLLVYGGQTGVSPATYADPTKLYGFGVGTHPSVAGWQVLTPAGDPGYGYPDAVIGQATTPILRAGHVTDRRWAMFGGEDVSGALVDPDLWYLARPDTSISNLNGYQWFEAGEIANNVGPSARTGAGMSYIVDGELVTIFGGDTTGTSVVGGYSNELWTHGVAAYAQEGWRTPPVRSFHPVPPPMVGMRFLTPPVGSARIARSMERFRSDASSSAGAGCEALPGQWETTTLQTDAESERAIADYPYMFELPDGRLFNAGPSPYAELSYRYKRFFDFDDQRWHDDATGDQLDAARFGSAVMYRPGKLLRAGGYPDAGKATDRTESIDLSAPNTTPAWQTYETVHPQEVLSARRNHNLTLLPTGDVLATGGENNAGWNSGGAQNQPTRWRVAQGRWDNQAIEERGFRLSCG